AYGRLSLSATVPTGGAGTGAGIGSSGALALSEDGRWLFAVNAGDNTISLLKWRSTGLKLVDTVPSGGALPVSVAVSGDLVYVLNDGAPANITGFAFDDDRGALYPIANSTRPLSAASPAAPKLGPVAPEIGFDNSGLFLYVTELGTSLIDRYEVQEDGTPDGPHFENSHGQSPYGFSFDRWNHLIVSEVFEVQSPLHKGAVSSYQLDDDGILTTISGSVPDFQTAPCWLVVTRNGKFAYTSNTASGNISGYRVRYSGEISLLEPGGISATTGGPKSGPLDLALTRASRFLYVINGAGTLLGWRVRADGQLIFLNQIEKIPASATGLVAR
ncbi:MAG: lactonase family protein, partial [Acidobacteriaceae bacterium]